MAVQSNYGTGRRKSAVARVYIKPGKGDIIVNGKPVDQFFSRETGRMIVRQPLVITDNTERFDYYVIKTAVVWVAAQYAGGLHRHRLSFCATSRSPVDLWATCL